MIKLHGLLHAFSASQLHLHFAHLLCKRAQLKHHMLPDTLPHSIWLFFFFWLVGVLCCVALCWLRFVRWLSPCLVALCYVVVTLCCVRCVACVVLRCAVSCLVALLCLILLRCGYIALCLVLSCCVVLRCVAFVLFCCTLCCVVLCCMPLHCCAVLRCVVLCCPSLENCYFGIQFHNKFQATFSRWWHIRGT